jgi:hypothetical protein
MRQHLQANDEGNGCNEVNKNEDIVLHNFRLLLLFAALNYL